MDCIIFYLKLECFTLLNINALIRYVGNSSYKAFTPCCTLNCPCHLKFMLYVRITEPQFSAYLFKIITFLANNSVGYPAATNLQTLCDSYFIDRLAFMTDIIIDSF